MRCLPLLMASLLCFACQDGDDSRSGPIHRAHSDGVSFAALEGWTIERDRDTWVQRGDGESNRTTIAVRSIRRDGWSEDRTPELVLPATQTSLGTLPGSKVSGPEHFEHPEYRADVFRLAFEPRSKRGQRYERHHVVLFSENRVFHVLHTGPQGSLEHSHKQFEKVVKSVREEG